MQSNIVFNPSQINPGVANTFQAPGAPIVASPVNGPSADSSLFSDLAASIKEAMPAIQGYQVAKQDIQDKIDFGKAADEQLKNPTQLPVSAAGVTNKFEHAGRMSVFMDAKREEMRANAAAHADAVSRDPARLANYEQEMTSFYNEQLKGLDQAAPGVLAQIVPTLVKDRDNLHNLLRDAAYKQDQERLRQSVVVSTTSAMEQVKDGNYSSPVMAQLLKVRGTGMQEKTALETLINVAGQMTENGDPTMAKQLGSIVFPDGSTFMQRAGLFGLTDNLTKATKGGHEFYDRAQTKEEQMKNAASEKVMEEIETKLKTANKLGQSYSVEQTAELIKQIVSNPSLIQKHKNQLIGIIPEFHAKAVGEATVNEIILGGGPDRYKNLALAVNQGKVSDKEAEKGIVKASSSYFDAANNEQDPQKRIELISYGLIEAREAAKAGMKGVSIPLLEQTANAFSTGNLVDSVTGLPTTPVQHLQHAMFSQLLLPENATIRNTYFSSDKDRQTLSALSSNLKSGLPWAKALADAQAFATNSEGQRDAYAKRMSEMDKNREADLDEANKTFMTDGRSGFLVANGQGGGWFGADWSAQKGSRAYQTIVDLKSAFDETYLRRNPAASREDVNHAFTDYMAQNVVFSKLSNSGDIKAAHFIPEAALKGVTSQAIKNGKAVPVAETAGESLDYVLKYGSKILAEEQGVDSTQFNLVYAGGDRYAWTGPGTEGRPPISLKDAMDWHRKDQVLRSKSVSFKDGIATAINNRIAADTMGVVDVKQPETESEKARSELTALLKGKMKVPAANSSDPEARYKAEAEAQRQDLINAGAPVLPASQVKSSIPPEIAQSIVGSINNQSGSVPKLSPEQNRRAEVTNQTSPTAATLSKSLVNKGDYVKALTVAIEDYPKNGVTTDPAGGTVWGFGLNLQASGATDVQLTNYLSAAGKPSSPEALAMAKKGKNPDGTPLDFTPEQSLAMLDLALPDYKNMAISNLSQHPSITGTREEKRAKAQAEFNKLPPEQQAALTYFAFNAGKGLIGEQHKAFTAMKDNLPQNIRDLKWTWTDPKTKQSHQNSRLLGFVANMASGAMTFANRMPS